MDTCGWDCLCAGPAFNIGMLYGNLDEVHELISKWDKDKIITAQEELVKSLQTQLTSQSHFIHALFKELEEAKAGSKERHARGKAKADLATSKHKNTLRIKTTRKRKK